VIEPGKYDIILIDGSQQTVLQKGVSLTRGENRIVYDPQTKKLGDKTRAQIANEKSQKEENKGVSGTGKNNGVEGKTTGEDRPESNMTTMTDQRISFGQTEDTVRLRHQLQATRGH
jgi:hypothetical protein